MTAPDEDAIDRVRLAAVRARAAAGLSTSVETIVAAGVDGDAVALAVAQGAPLGPVLAIVQERVDAADALRAEVRRASAEGRTVATGLVVAPPLLGAAATALVTDDPAAVLLSSEGRSLLVVAAVLWVLGAAAVVALVRSAARPPVAGDGPYVLAATALRSGAPLGEALRTAAVHAGRSGGSARSGGGDPAALALWVELGAAGDPPPGGRRTGPVLAEAVADGVPLAPLLDELARDARRRAHAAAVERAARLGARLSLPTALLLLPAGLVVAAGPVLLAALEALR